MAEYFFRTAAGRDTDILSVLVQITNRLTDDIGNLIRKDIAEHTIGAGKVVRPKDIAVNIRVLDDPIQIFDGISVFYLDESAQVFIAFFSVNHGVRKTVTVCVHRSETACAERRIERRGD